MKTKKDERIEAKSTGLLTCYKTKILKKMYTLETLAARLNRSVVGVRTRLRTSGRIPKGRRNGQPGGYLVWDVDEIEAAIAADPGLVIPNL